jgi:RNA polymerase sigma factor (sigma-70 family)
MPDSVIAAPPEIKPLDHIKLVVSIANRYRGRGLDLEDLVQEGFVGLLNACRTFRPGDGNAFSTLATVAIRREIWTALSRIPRPVRIPEKVYLTVVQLRTGRVRRDELTAATRAKIADAEWILTREVHNAAGFAGRRDEERRHRPAAEARDRARACLEALGPRDRTFAEIGAALGTSRQNARGYYCRALHVMRRHIEDTETTGDRRRRRA